MAKCAICRRVVDGESAPILELSGYGYTRVLCDECAEELDLATLGTDAEKIAEAMDSIGKKMSVTDADPHTFETVDGILRNAMENMILRSTSRVILPILTKFPRRSVRVRRTLRLTKLTRRRQKR